LLWPPFHSTRYFRPNRTLPLLGGFKASIQKIRMSKLVITPKLGSLMYKIEIHVASVN